MATAQNLIDRTRRLIAEAGATPDTDQNILDFYVNPSFYVAQARINEIDDAEFMAGATANIVANQARYERATFEHVRRYELLEGTRYVELPMLLAEQAIPRKGEYRTYTDAQQRWGPAYYVEGREIVLVPTPTVSVTAGLGVVFFDPISLVNVADTPRMPVALHHVIPYGAAVLALDESKDAAEDIVGMYRARWASVFGMHEGSTQDSRAALRRHYRRSQSLPMIGMNLSP